MLSNSRKCCMIMNRVRKGKRKKKNEGTDMIMMMAIRVEGRRDMKICYKQMRRTKTRRRWNDLTFSGVLCVRAKERARDERREERRFPRRLSSDLMIRRHLSIWASGEREKSCRKKC